MESGLMESPSFSSDGCTGFQWVENLFTGVRDCCVSHDMGLSDGLFFDCLAASTPPWLLPVVAVCFTLMIFFRPLYHLIRDAGKRLNQ